MNKFDKNKLQERLQHFNSKQQLAFGFVIAERLLPNYLPFYQDEKWGNPQPLVSGMEYVWGILSGEKIDNGKVEDLSNAIEAVFPDADEFRSEYTGIAQDPCVAILYLLEFIKYKDIGCIGWVAETATNCIDSYVQTLYQMPPFPGKNREEFEQRILETSEMQHELTQQEKELTFIEKHPAMTHDDLLALNALWPNHKKSNLDLPKDA
jgi:uncharacterized protein YjaG (DUF416 family)